MNSTDRLGSKEHLSKPIFTLDLAIAKFYVVNSIPLISQIQRNAKSLSFEPFHLMAVKKGFGVQGPGFDLLKEARNGGGGLDSQLNNIMKASLLGPDLTAMNEMMLPSLVTGIEHLEKTEGSSIDLYEWCQDT